MKPPDYCRRCDKEIPATEEISSIRDLLKDCGILLKRGDAETAREALESLGNVCLSRLHGEECAVVSRASQSEDVDLTTDLDDLFEGLVARAREDVEGRTSQRHSQDKRRTPIGSFKGPPMGLERLELLHYQNLVFEAPESDYTTDQIPSWGLDSRIVLGLLSYLDPYSENQRTKNKLQCVYDAIRERWWSCPLLANAPLREMDAASVEKLMFAIREKGNEVLHYEPESAGPCWLLRRDASDRVHRRFLKHVNLNLFDKTRGQAIGYLVAPMPAPRLLEEGPFIEIVKIVLHLWHLEAVTGGNPITNEVIRKAIRLIGLQNLKKISPNHEIAIRDHVFSNVSSLAITPGDVANFLGEHPDMCLTNYDNDIRALLNGFEPESLAVLWLQADSHIRNQIIDAFGKSDLQCALCELRLPNKEERRWSDRMREWIGQRGLYHLYHAKKQFCLCPEKDLERSDNEPSQWRRKRAKLVAAVLLRYPHLEWDRRHARKARFLLKKMTDLMNGKRLRNENLKRELRRFADFGGKRLYGIKGQVPGHGKCCVAELIDTPLFSKLLSFSDKQHPTAQDELLLMLRLLSQFFNPSQAQLLFDSQYPAPRRKYDPHESVWRHMADEDFDGDPWDDDYKDPDFPQESDYTYIDALADLDALPDPKQFALDTEMEAVAETEPEMSEAELREKVYWEHPEYRGLIGLDWYKTCDARLMPGMLGVGGEPFANGIRYHKFDDLRMRIEGMVSGNRFYLRSLDRNKLDGKSNV